MKVFKILLGLAFILFLVVFFGSIGINAKEYNEERRLFKAACEEQNGFFYVVKTGRGWPDFLCFSKDAIIQVDIDE